MTLREDPAPAPAGTSLALIAAGSTSRASADLVLSGAPADGRRRPAGPNNHAAAFLPPSEVCSRIWASDFYGRAVLDADGTIRWVNDACAAMVGRTPVEVIGRSMADFLAPEDVMMAIEALTEIQGEESVAHEGVPLVLGLNRADGSVVQVEIGADSFLDVPEIRAISLRLRPYDSQWYLERFLTALVRGAPMEIGLMLLVQSIDHLVQECSSAIAYGWDGAEFTKVVTAGVPLMLSGMVDVDPDDLDRLPWVRCQRSGEIEWSLVEDLPPAVRTIAAEHGLQACWAEPILVRNDEPVAVFVVWRRLASSPRISHRRSLDQCCQAASLAFERQRSEQLLVRAATVDALTGMPNRSQFFASLGESMDSTAPGRLGILYLDLDGFKPVNDTHGHRMGDRLLVEVSALLSASVRPGDMVARLGGDEFAVLCVDVAGEDELCAVADRLIRVVSQPVVLDGTEVLIGVSIGVAVATVHGGTQDEVLDAADAALYRAKREGRGRYRVAVPDGPGEALLVGRSD